MKLRIEYRQLSTCRIRIPEGFTPCSMLLCDLDFVEINVVAGDISVSPNYSLKVFDLPEGTHSIDITDPNLITGRLQGRLATIVVLLKEGSTSTIDLIVADQAACVESGWIEVSAGLRVRIPEPASK